MQHRLFILIALITISISLGFITAEQGLVGESFISPELQRIDGPGEGGDTEGGKPKDNLCTWFIWLCLE